MKTKQLLIMAFVALVPLFTLSSCQSREERVISRIEALCDEIENDDDFDKDDFETYTEEYNDIVSDAEDCEFSPEQQKRLSKSAGRLMSVMTMKMTGTMFGTAGDILNQGMNMMGDFMEGFADGFSDDIDDDMDDIDGSLNKIGKK